MKKSLVVFALIATLCSSALYAGRPQAILGPGVGIANFRVPYHETVNRVLSRDTTYILTGWYFIDSTYSITIEAGTLIRGDSASGGTLIVKRGAHYYGVGTREAPIVFTSNKPAGTRTPGDWGGVILQGSAPTMEPTTWQAEGGFGTIPNSDAMYGGSDPNDNVGIMTYTRIEFAGIAFSQDNETNGLTLCGVGRGTTLDYIQVSFSNDDDVECFGGTVDLKHYIGWRMVDDDIDTDLGWQGRVQFAYEKRDKNLFDASAAGASHGFESDGQPPTAVPAVFPDLPHTGARVSNVTVIGPEPDTTTLLNAKWSAVAILRRGTYFSTYNSILMGYPEGIDIRDTATERYALQDSLQIRNTSLQSKRKVVIKDTSPSTASLSLNVLDWFNGVGGYPATGNIGSTARQPADVGLLPAAFNLDRTNNPIPPVGSECDTASTAFDGRLAGDSFFDTTAHYRGAFDPHKPRDQQWDWGWSEYEPENYDPEATVSSVSYSLADSWNMVSVPMRDVDNPAVHSLFPTATTNAFSYAGSYVPNTSMTHGIGYWLKFSGAQSANIIGAPAEIDTFHLGTNWNIVGSVKRPVPISTIVQNPPAILISNYYGYNGVYQIADTIKPGKAYWVKSNSVGQLYMDGFSNTAAPKSSALKNDLALLDNLTIKDAQGLAQELYFGEDKSTKIAVDRYELPPLPPSGGFDARFASGRMVETMSGASREFPINIQGGTYPLTISVKGTQSFATIQIVELSNGNVVRTQSLSTGGSVTISDDGFDRLVLKVGGMKAIPATFALNQNYPNPFNPSTHIDIEVPSDSKVDVSIYNILGQKVATLLDGNTTAGYHTLEWNGNDAHGSVLPSGIYFVRMTGEKFNAVRKVMMMK